MHSVLLLATLCVGAYAQFSASGQAAIVDAHNAMRSKIAKGTYVARGTQKPAGSNIRKMKWDATVAASAQSYANTCPKDHSGVAGLGENLFWNWSGASPSNLDQYGTAASAAWEKEFQDNGWTSNKLDVATFNTGIGHATQMAWAKTNLVGCGVKNCGKDTNGMYKVAVVCQYKQQGNYVNQNIYNAGATCSACLSGTSCEQSTGLCA